MCLKFLKVCLDVMEAQGRGTFFMKYTLKKKKVYLLAYIVFAPTFGILSVWFKTGENSDYQTQ